MEYTLKDSYIKQASYNAEANKTMFEILSNLTGKARHRDCGSYFGSIWGIIDHIVTAEYIWLDRFKALLPDASIYQDKDIRPDHLSWYDDLCKSFEELKGCSAYIDEKLIQWFREFPEDKYAENFQYQDSSGTMRDAQAGKAFDYLFVHQLHHRGQISQILDVAGLPNNFADNGLFLEG